MKISALTPVFIRAIPDQLEDGKLYVSLDYRTASHRCCCGCGREVVTPFGPTDWKFSFDGKVSLHPSIGNWNFPCRSHYWIRANAIHWAEQWSDEQIAAGQAHERRAKERFYTAPPLQPTTSTPRPTLADNGFWARVRRWLQGK